MNFWSFVTTGVLGNIFASQVVRSTTFGPPDFVSDWFTIKANKKVFPALEIRHNLSEIPAIVEVQVKSMESPNNNYIFPAIGIGQRDDDMPVDYGGVIYIYNAEYIRIQTPIGYNNLGVGSVIYTGGSPYWTGPNFQKSMQASVRVRAWRGLSLPLPGYHEDNITIDARSTDSSKVYIEKTHGLRKYPVYVKTRIHLTNGQYAGWVTDALGSTMIAYSVQEWWYRTIGVISAYDDFHVRVWVHSNQQVGVIFSTEDGWGSPYHMNPTTTGRVEIFAWNDFGYPPLIKTSYDIGPGVTNERLEFPINKMTVDELFFDVMVEAKQGTNAGFRFRGVGSAMTNTWNLNSVCGYGGLIYAYNNQSIRLWRPTSGHGGYTACIGSIFGNGQNSLAQENVRVVITVWTLFPLSVKKCVELGVLSREDPSRSNAVTDQPVTTPERPITTYDDSSEYGDIRVISDRIRDDTVSVNYCHISNPRMKSGLFLSRMDDAISSSSTVDPPVIACAYMSLLEADSDRSSLPLAQYPSADTDHDCYNQCIKYRNCTIFSVGNGSCKLFSINEPADRIDKFGTKIWIFKWQKQYICNSTIYIPELCSSHTLKP